MITGKDKFKVLNAQPGSHQIDLIGQKFGLLSVKKYSHNDKYQNKVWECLCDCGNVALVTTTQLKQGRTTSCKCNQYKKGEEVYNFTGYKEITGAKWYSVKQNATNRGLDFNITKDFVWELLLKQQNLCRLSGIPISFKDGTASIDRIDNALGYSETNIQVVHKDVNLMRNKFEIDYFVGICKKIEGYNRH